MLTFNTLFIGTYIKIFGKAKVSHGTILEERFIRENASCFNLHVI
jgi:hypothetical protein